MKFSVLMSIYFREKPSYLEKSLQSLNNQTIKADEVVLVKDGYLTPELEKIIDKYAEKLNIKCIALKNNVGLGLALQKGILYCHNDIVARMDTDDICHHERFEKQITFLQNNPDIGVIGSWISEFEDNPNSVYACRELPTKHQELLHFAKKRNPLNHMTVMYRKKSVLAAGNYQSLLYFEDYYLWIRMMIKGAKFANIPECLVAARAGQSMIDRRGGLLYARNEILLQREFLRLGFINKIEFVRNILIRTTIFLMPSKLRKLLYSFILRQNNIIP